MNLPNKISLIRIAMIPVFVLFFYLNFPYHFVVSAGIFALAALTDALDGHIARSRHMITNLGKFLDPIADKVLVATAFVLMVTEEKIFGVFGSGFEIAGTICVCIILARELIISAFRQIAAAQGIVLAAEKLGKYKTTFQDVCIVVLLVAASFTKTAGKVFNAIGLALFLVATVLTIISGISYIVKNKQVLKNTSL